MNKTANKYTAPRMEMLYLQSEDIMDASGITMYGVNGEGPAQDEYSFGTHFGSN